MLTHATARGVGKNPSEYLHSTGGVGENLNDWSYDKN